MSEVPIKLTDNDYNGRELSETEAKKLSRFAGVGLDQLCQDNPGLLLFPSCLGDNGDKIEDPLYSLVGNRICTGNIVGFWGVEDVNVRVHSRFDEDERQYFFHYMLQRIAGVNVLNLPTLPDGDSIWDFLIYLFPMALKRAVRQGIYRTYRAFNYDDEHVRGTIDVSRFIRRDIPFRGSVSYATREHTANNPVLQLVRHTIEYIRRKAPALLRVDGEMAGAVESIVQLTPDYSEKARVRVMAANLRPVRHPFYSAYTGLQKLCLQILRQEKFSFGEREGEISGIVFDAAWLWEEYLAAVFAADPATVGIVHPRNRLWEDPIYIYENDKTRRSARYPDFYDESRRLVLDAKYKGLEESSVNRDDLYQLISYIHVLDYTSGGGVLLYPGTETTYSSEGVLKGCGGVIGRLSLQIPQVGAYGDYSTFLNWILQEETRFRIKIENMAKRIAE